jgi:hypothetical protein
MPVINNAFNGKLNLDVAPYRIDSGDYLDALNITRDSQGEGSDKVVANILGNTNVVYELPTGDNKVIGFYPDRVRNRGYYFVYNSLGTHSILYYSANVGTVTEVLQGSLLNFNPSYKVLSVNIFYRDDEGDILFFNDAYNEPRSINVTATYSTWLPEYLSVAKAPPIMPPKPVYENDTTIKVNNLRNALFQFSYRYVYDNNEKSVWSSKSIVPLPQQSTLQLTGDTYTNNSRISVSFTTGGDDVKAIELSFRQTKDSVTSDWYLIKSFKKSDLSVSDNDIYTFKFYNDSVYTVVDVLDTIQLQDFVPQIANAGELANGNTPLYAGITEGYDKTVMDLSVSINQDSSDFYTDYAGLQFFSTIDGRDSGTIGTTMKVYLYGTGTNTAGAVTTLNNAAAYYKINVVNGSGTQIGVTVNNTNESETVANLLALVSSGLVTNGWTQVSLVGNILTMSYPTNVTLQSSGLKYITSTQKSNITAFANAFESGYQYAIQYFDSKGRTIGAQTSVNASFTTPINGGVNYCQPRITITNRPPLEAVYYQILRSANTTYNKRLFWISDAAYSNTVSQVTDQQYAYVGISNIAYYNEQISATQGVVSYNFTQGDRIKFYQRYNAAGTAISITNYDYEILGIEADPNIGGVVKKGTYVKIKYPTADIGSELKFDGSADYQNYGILLYNYVNNTSSVGRPFYEFGKCFGIGNFGTANAYHMGLEQTQTANLATPAIISCTNGDLFWRKRVVPIGAMYEYPSGLYPQTDAFGTCKITVAGSPITTTNYTIASQTNLAASLAAGSYPTWFDNDCIFRNLSASDISVRLRGNINVVSDKNSTFSLYVKFAYDGGVNYQQILSNQSIPDASTVYNFAFDVVVKVPAVNKMFFLVGIDGDAPTFQIGGFDLRLDVLNNKTIDIIESSFSDVYNIVTNSNGRPSVVDENAKRTYFPTLIRFGQSYQANTNINGTNRFVFENFDEYDRSFGDVIRLHVRDRYLKVYQKFKVGNVPILTQIVKDVTGNPLQSNSDQLINKIQYYAGDYGIGDAGESLAWNNFADYFTDNYRGVVCRLSQDGITPISIAYGMNAFFVPKLNAFRKELNSSPPMGNPCIYGVFDAYTNKYILALEQINRSGFSQEAYTIAFDENANAFESFYSYKPEFMGNLNTLLLTFKEGQLWKHDSTTYCNFYGTQYNSSITAIFNSNSLDKKTWISLMETGSGVWVCPEIETQLNSYGTTKQTSNLIESDFKALESEYHASFLRDVQSIGGLINGDALKGGYIKIKFQKSNANSFVYLNSASVKYINSPLNNR